MQPDPYNQNNYNNNSNWGYNQPPASPIQPLVDLIKGNLKTIILLIIVVGAGYFAYDYFVASQINVKILVNDLSGNPVQTITSANVWQNEKVVPKSGFTNSSKSLVLQRGTYEVRVSADGFEDKIEIIDVSDKSFNFPVLMTKKTNVRLQPVTGFPTQIFAGQTIESVLTLENSGPAETINVKATISPAKLTGFNVTMNPAQVLVSGGTQSITATIQTDESLTISERDGKEITVTFNIEGTTQTQKVIIKAFKSANITTSPKTFNITRADAGKLTPLSTITFKNNDNTAYEDFSPRIRFEVISSTNSAQDINQWFKFITTPSGVLDKKGSVSMTFNLDVPSDALDDQITGKFIFETDYWQQEIPVTIKVLEAKNLAVFTVTPNSYSVSIDEETSKYEIKIGSIRIQNTTNFAFNNLSIKTKDATNCNTNYLKYTGEVNYPTLDNTVGANAIEIPIAITAPIAATKDTVKSCTVLLTYDDPVDAGNTVSIERLVKITPSS